MPELRVVVVDDEPPARRGLVAMLAAHADVVVAGEAANGVEAVRAIRAARPDLVLLDVEMPGLDGFGVLRALGAEVPPLVVFVTAFDDYAVRAFEVHAADYLVKPFSDRRLADALARARAQLQQAEVTRTARQLAALLAAATATAPAAALAAPPAASSGPAAASLVATTGRRSVVIPIERVEWIEAEDYCVLVHTGQASYLLRESLRGLEPRLATCGFARVHRSALVNLARVRELRRPPQREWSIVLDSGAEIAVSRRLRPVVVRYLAARREPP
jgi:two-component system LytT family response regulator